MLARGTRDLAAAQVVLELHRRDRAVMARKRLDDGLSGTSLLVSRIMERAERILDPLPVDAASDGSDRRSAIGSLGLPHALTAPTSAESM